MTGKHAYKRGIGPLGLLMSSVSAMIGSGWLFSSLYVGRIAGPAAVLAWIFGGALVVLVALTYAELSTILPITGGSTRFPQLTHGTFISLFFGWITWFGLMTAPPIETQAMLQYAGSFWPFLLAHQPNSITGLSTTGYIIAIVMMILFSVLNVYSIRLITCLNNFLSIWKVATAVLTACVLLYLGFHQGHHNFHNPATGGFLPNGWKSVFIAVAGGGIIFTFNGFKQSVELAGEAKNPTRTILTSIIGSIVVVLVVYMLLQLGLISALDPSALAEGWSHLHFSGDTGPLAGLLMMAGLFWMTILLYISALVATGSAGLVYSTSAARTLYGLSANRQLPAFLQEVTERGMPAKAVLVNFIIGMTFFLPFHSWHAMVEFMSSIIALSYLTGPICCLSMRYQLPDHHRAFRLPFVRLWCFAAFYICTIIVYWTGWAVVSKLGLCLFMSFVLFIVYRLFSQRPRGVNMNWRATAWIWPYLAGLNLISYYGSYGGGLGKITFGTDFIYIGLLSLISLYIALKYRASDQHVSETLMRFEEEVATGIPATVPDEQAATSNLIR